MCAFFGISRAAYYAWVNRIEAPDPDAERMSKVLEAFEASHQTYGYRRTTIYLQV
jgi:predicted DNA-binding transcriptional regulator AlpA